MGSGSGLLQVKTRGLFTTSSFACLAQHFNVDTSSPGKGYISRTLKLREVLLGNGRDNDSAKPYFSSCGVAIHSVTSPTDRYNSSTSSSIGSMLNGSSNDTAISSTPKNKKARIEIAGIMSA